MTTPSATRGTAAGQRPPAQGLYLFGVAPATVEIPQGCTGVGVAVGPVTTVRHGNIAAIVNPVSQVRALGSRSDLLNHSDVLNRVAATTPVLPARFGMVLPSQQALVAELLQARRDQIEQAIGKLTGKAEFTVDIRYQQRGALRQVLAEDPEIRRLRQLVAESGRYEDRLRLGELVAGALARRRAAMITALHTSLCGHATAWLERPVAAEDLAVSMAFLVDSTQRDAFVAAAELLAAQVSAQQTSEDQTGNQTGDQTNTDSAESSEPVATVRLVGPIAAYDFAEPALGGQI